MLGLRTLVVTGSRSTAFKRDFFGGGFYPDTATNIQQDTYNQAKSNPPSNQVEITDVI